MADKGRIVAYFTHDLRVGDICALFEGNTNIYDYRLAVDPESDGIVLMEGP